MPIVNHISSPILFTGMVVNFSSQLVEKSAVGNSDLEKIQRKQLLNCALDMYFKV